ncbi:hypothetical protein FOA52_013310 [Chlamydomonas sp. UWO 241]|nr:hypothetical protein FOA52_013310 [Chlamydomonas sp. UWO 241]
MADPSDSLDLMRYYKSFSAQRSTHGFCGITEAGPTGALLEDVKFDPPVLTSPEFPDGFNPEVLPSGKTIELQLGYGAEFGNKQGTAQCKMRCTELGTCCLRSDDGQAPPSCTNVRLEIGRNSVLHECIFGTEQHSVPVGAERFLAPFPMPGVQMLAQWDDPALWEVLDMQPDPTAGLLQKRKLLKRATNRGCYTTCLECIVPVEQGDAAAGVPQFLAVWSRPLC